MELSRSLVEAFDLDELIEAGVTVARSTFLEALFDVPSPPRCVLRCPVYHSCAELPVESFAAPAIPCRMRSSPSGRDQQAPEASWVGDQPLRARRCNGSGPGRLSSSARVYQLDFPPGNHDILLCPKSAQACSPARTSLGRLSRAARLQLGQVLPAASIPSDHTPGLALLTYRQCTFLCVLPAHLGAGERVRHSSAVDALRQHWQRKLVQIGAEDAGSKATILMAWCQYVGNALKDLICAPRPINVTDGETSVTLLALPAREETELNAKVGCCYGISTFEQTPADFPSTAIVWPCRNMAYLPLTR